MYVLHAACQGQQHLQACRRAPLVERNLFSLLLVWHPYPPPPSPQPPPQPLSTLQLGVLTGSQNDQQRSKTLGEFNSAALQVLLTSDAFGLGLDYKGVDVVVCLNDPAPSYATYVARWVVRMGLAGGGGG